MQILFKKLNSEDDNEGVQVILTDNNIPESEYISEFDENELELIHNEEYYRFIDEDESLGENNENEQKPNNESNFFILFFKLRKFLKINIST